MFVVGGLHLVPRKLLRFPSPFLLFFLQPRGAAFFLTIRSTNYLSRGLTLSITNQLLTTYQKINEEVFTSCEPYGTMAGLATMWTRLEGWVLFIALHAYLLTSTYAMFYEFGCER